MNFNKFITSIPLRADVLDDITYLQKHLRLIIKYHQKLSAKLYYGPPQRDGVDPVAIRSRNFASIRKVMDELELEMEDISNEQKLLTDIVKSCVLNYRRALKEKSGIIMEQDVANGFITRALHNHYEKNYFNIMPSNVKPRFTEEDLKHKYDEVKGDAATEKAVMKMFMLDKKRSGSKPEVKRESLLKANFRKPLAGGLIPKKSKTVVVKRGGGGGVRGRKPAAKQDSSPSKEAITHGRLNLLRALSKIKTEQSDNKDEVDKFYTEKCKATLAEVSEDGTFVRFLRSDEEYSDKSSSYDGEMDPLKMYGRKRRSPGGGVHSEESSDGDYMKKYPNLPIEPPPKLEYNQEEYLTIFKLITPEVAEKLKLRRSERRRRNISKNQKTDFHYGSFDLNEAAIRVRLNNKRSILYSPNYKIKSKY